jgi:Leucine-rich repeat (LRR) protein
VPYDRRRLLGHFRTLWLNDMGVECCDEGVSALSALEELSLSNNTLTSVDYLPSSLRVLRANANLYV